MPMKLSTDEMTLKTNARRRLTPVWRRSAKSPNSWGNSWHKTANAVAIPVTGSTPNAAPMAIPSVRLCKPSPMITMNATGVRAPTGRTFVSLTITFSSIFFFEVSRSLSRSSQLPQLLAGFSLCWCWQSSGLWITCACTLFDIGGPWLWPPWLWPWPAFPASNGSSASMKYITNAVKNAQPHNQTASASLVVCSCGSAPWRASPCTWLSAPDEWSCGINACGIKCYRREEEEKKM